MAPRQVSDLSRQGLDVLIRRLRGKGTRPRPDPAGPADATDRGAADLRPSLSFAQERLWLVDRLRPGGAAYNLPAALRLRGALDRAALAGALAGVVRRHAVLRTTFAEEGAESAHPGWPYQVVRPGVLGGEPGLPLIDLTGLPGARRDGAARRLAAEEAARPFDLAVGPLVRAALLRETAEEHVLLLSLHHIVADGGSLALLAGELAAHYAGRAAELPPLPLQFADLAGEERERLAGPALAPLLGYWRERLAGAPARLALPADRPQPPRRTERGVHVHFAISALLRARLEALGEDAESTLFTVLLTAWKILLLRVTGGEDLVVGAPVAGRGRIEAERLIGFFVNTLPLRTDLGGDPEVATALARVRETVRGALAHQELPFARLVEELAPDRTHARDPLVQVVLAYQAAPWPDLALPGLAVERIEIARDTAKFDLAIELEEGAGDRLQGVVEASADLFDRATARRLADAFASLLAGMAADPRARLSDLPLLNAGERHQLLCEWSATAEAPAARCVHELFEEAAAADPAAVALDWDGGSMRYGELEEAANRLANALHAAGIGPEERVALCLERSAAFPLAALAVLKAGGAYVPLDPTWPAERLALLLAEAEPALVLTAESLRAVVPAGPWRTLSLDGGAMAAEMASASPRRPASGATPDTLAYLMYTSGSTGRPKGVAVVHRAVSRLVRGGCVSLGPAETLLLFAPLAFDASTFELWGALGNGGRLAIFPPAAELSELGPALARFGVTTLWLTAGLFHQIVDADPGALAPVRQLLAGGDALSAPHVRRLLAALPGCRLTNGYGPTENTTFTCCHTVVSPVEVGETVPLGRAIAGTTVHLVDSRGGLVPAGVAGELWTGGEGLARGYCGRPELTAASFVPDPFAGPGEGGGRLYRTGDLARRRADGVTLFLGRVDAQVKVRGFRVEPGEVEAALAAQPRVAASAVVARPDPAGGRRLVAYIVAADGAPLDPAELRSFLAARLPAPMVPALFCLLPALPLTANGKVDRAALPEPPAADTPTGPASRSLTPAGPASRPASPTEELLAALWAEVLGVERVGIDDDFFALGGHSLLATRLLSKLRAVFAVEVPMAALFEAPTVSGLAVRLEALLRSGAAPAGPIPALGRSAGAALGPAADVELPLSFAQERLWFLDQLTPGSAVYNVPLAVAAQGELPIAALAAALAEVTRRHEALRARFPSRDGRAVVVIAPAVPAALPLADLAALPAARRALLATALAEEDGLRPFDLAAGPLLRWTLLRLVPREHVLVLVAHHIVTDGWSTGVLLGEITALCEAFATGRPSPLPELPVQVTDYAAWQRQWMSGDVLAAELAHWRGELEALPALDLPTDRPRPPARRQLGASRTVHLPPALTAAVEALARRLGATPFMVLLTGFAALLARWSGQADFAVGSPVANRTRPEVEGLIGLFVNTLALRADLTGSPSGGEALARLRTRCLAAYAHQDVPFDRLVEELAPARDLARTPLVQVMLALQTAPPGRLALPGVALDPLTRPSRVARFDLTLLLAPTPGGLRGTVEYDRELFDGATVERLLGQLETLLAGFCSEPDRRLAELGLMTPAERQQVLEWSGVADGFPPGRPVQELFAEQVARTPDAVALAEGEERVSYGELARQARALAARLRAIGVGPEAPEVREVIIGVCLERSLRYAVAILAVLEAGGAYLPLDPTYPRERLEYVLADSRAVAVVTEERFAAALPEPLPPGVCRLILDAPGADAAAGNSARSAGAPVPVSPNALAYVMYTSGSTGKPKGVAVTHRGIDRLVRDASWARMDAGEVFLMLTPLSFDVSTFEIWGALLNGACLAVLPGRGVPLAELGAAIRRHGVTTLWLSAGLFQQQVELDLPALAPLRQLVAGGDALSAPHVRRALAGLPGCRLIDGYGPTENTTFTACWGTSSAAEVGSSVSIGRPIAGTTIHLVDGDWQRVPVGVPGELWTGGAGLARGYLGRPDLTAERFVPSPFAPSPCADAGERLYRTGDRARWLPDGRLEYLGRLDGQVKVRGFRVEIGEVEAALAGHPGVRECAVAALPDPAGGKRLVAYLVAGEPAPSLPELRRHLLARLPEFMVPALFEQLPALPLSANGKVDRRALPAPRGLTGAAARTHAAPRSPLEEIVAGLWCELLGVARVGIEESFFDLGGHSLLATRLVSRVRSLLGVEIALRDLFEAPTVAGLAARIAAHAPTLTVPAEAVAIPARAGMDDQTEDGSRLSFAQERLWFLDQLDPGNPVYNVPLALRCQGGLAAAALSAAISEVVRRHQALRTVFPARDGLALQRLTPAGEVPLPVVDLSALPAGQREGLALDLAAVEASRPFDLARGPLLRSTLIRLAREEHAILVTMHHIVADGWSNGVLLGELDTLYGAFAAGHPSPLPELPIQYADFAAWQRGWLAGEVLDAQLGYWRQRLAGLPALALPTDRPRPDFRRGRGSSRPLHLPAALAGELAALARTAGATPFMVLLAAFQALLGRWSRQQDFAVGTPIANRNRLDTEGLIGLFVNSLALRADLAGSPTGRELVTRSRRECLAAYAHQDLPFDRLVEELAPVRDPAQTPVFQVALVWQSAPLGPLALPGLRLTPFEVPSRTAKFDLSLAFLPAAEGPVAGLDGIAGWIEHDRDLFDGATAERFAGQLAALLAGLCRRPEEPAAELRVLSPGERHQTLVEDPAGPRELWGGLGRRVEVHGPWPILRAAVQASGPEPVRTLPRTALETSVAEIWSDLLGVGPVGVDESFFELGGHSLLATRLVARLQRTFGVELPLRRLFERPTVAGLAAEISGLVVDRGAAMALVPTTRPGEELPLSYAQERLWVLDRIEPGSSAYNVPVALRLAGRLDVAALAGSLRHLVARHGSLRTRFASRGGRPVQIVEARAALDLPVLDLTALPAAAREREAGRRTAEEAAAPFDLGRAPLLRTLLLRAGEDDWRLLLTVHHIVADGWSLGILVAECGRLYEELVRAPLSPRDPLPALPIQYADYAVWQRGEQTAATLAGQLGYWRQHLADLPTLDLPLDRPRPAVRGFRGEHRSLVLDGELTARLAALGRARGATPFMTLLAVFALLLARLGGEEDVAVGTPVAGRRRSEVEGLVGMFLNTLVLRLDLSPAPSFDALLARVRETALAAYAHQDVPFEMLLDALQPERDLSRTPLFQVFFNLLNFPLPDLRLPGLEVAAAVDAEAPSKFDLTAYVREAGGALQVDLVYNADLFAAPRIAEILCQYEGLLRQVAMAPERGTAELSLLTAAAAALLPDPREALDATWHGAVHELFAARARQDRERPAIVDRDGTWSYDELASQIERLAGRLLAAGLRPGEPVAVYAHRGAALAAAILGTLRAGGAFVLLDPAYPPARTIEMLRLAAPAAWIQLEAAGAPAAELASWVAAALPASRRLVLPPRVLPPGRGPGEVPAVALGPDSPAYIAFTSGSTGSPKGILGRHGPLSHFLPWMARFYDLGPDDRFSLLSALAHDPLQRDLFTPLCLGASVVVPDPREMMRAGWLAGWMRRERVTVANLTPAMAQVMTTGGESGEAPTAELPDLRYVFLVGDALTRWIVARLRRLAPAVTCINHYGSTETQRAVGFHLLPPPPAGAAAATAEEGRSEVLPLGRGIPDVQLLVLAGAAEGGRLAGIGEVGEITVRSPHLAAGYLSAERDPGGEADLGADARFRTNPFTGRAGDRIYRTGDLGRYGLDGEVTFAGRADQQVKVRGFRIELGEIEGRLARLPGVREAVVLAKEESAGDRRLVAYVVPAVSAVLGSAGGALLGADLRAGLQAELPAYMVPSAFVVLERLPLTANGKLDRRALLRLAVAPAAGGAYREPATDLERRIAGLLAEVLRTERVGAEDSFFELGGNSLLLVELHGRLERALGREIAVVDLFTHPSVAALARHLAPQLSPASPATSLGGDRTDKLLEGRNRLLRRRLERPVRALTEQTEEPEEER